MANVRTSRILGPSGRPVRITRRAAPPQGDGLRELGYFLYGSPRFNPRSIKPRYWLGADTKTNVSEFDRWEMVNYSRQLFAQIPALYAAVMQKNAWAFGEAWDAHYFGADQKWGEQAEEWLRWSFYPHANIRGASWDLKWSLKVSGYMLDVDGDDAMVFTEDEDGSPRLAFYPATRIGATAAGLNSPMIGASVDSICMSSRLFSARWLLPNCSAMAIANCRSKSVFRPASARFTSRSALSFAWW